MKGLGLLLEAAATALGNLVFRHHHNQYRAAKNGTLLLLTRLLGGHFLDRKFLGSADRIADRVEWEDLPTLVRETGPGVDDGKADEEPLGTQASCRLRRHSPRMCWVFRRATVDMAVCTCGCPCVLVCTGVNLFVPLALPLLYRGPPSRRAATRVVRSGVLRSAVP